MNYQDKRATNRLDADLLGTDAMLKDWAEQMLQHQEAMPDWWKAMNGILILEKEHKAELTDDALLVGWALQQIKPIERAVLISFYTRTEAPEKLARKLGLAEGRYRTTLRHSRWRIHDLLALRMQFTGFDARNS
ncbi:hypothetical protein UFOVP605_17 [uncultured Caudovirales phage]|uniref:Uncharacterized protein n=1 Tax=uncultured Caudovirales phage TaxID=2100421 RepID=A0A6J5N613_9CAUD|nr:hypothetical protein UFOVP605_17 [uncultured Caudovirales phage]